MKVPNFYEADAYEELKNFRSMGNNVDFVLTDPLYNLTTSQKTTLHQYFLSGSRFGYLVFSPPDNPFLPLQSASHNYFWMKPLSTKNYKKMRRPSNFVELAQFYQSHGQPKRWNAKDLHWSMSTNVAQDIVHHNDLHPWRKPLSLIKRFIKLYTNPGDVVLDPFAGSGVVAEACLQLDRKFICFDIDGELVEETKQRLGL